MDRFGLVSVVAIVALSGCRPGGDLADGKSELGELIPMLTDVREGNVEVDAADMPEIPEDEEVAGAILEGVEDLYLEGEDDDDRDPAISEDFSNMREIDNPLALEKHRDAEIYAWTQGTGTLIDDNYEGDIEFTDVQQGAIGNCYMAAAFSAVLYADQDHTIRDGLIRPIKDSDGFTTAYGVRVFHAWNGAQDVIVDADILRKGEKPVYGRSMDTEFQDEEFAISLMEKAFAQWRGDYETIGNGGYSGDVMQALTGSTASNRSLQWMSDASLLSAVSEAADDGRPMTASTFGKGQGPFGEDGGEDPDGMKIYAWHAYHLMDAAQGEDTLYLKLRNPWGRVEPGETGGRDESFNTELAKDDGIFWITAEHFRRLYRSITIGGTYEADTVDPAKITDLELSSLDEQEDGSFTAFLAFTAVGDDEDEALAYEYDVRISDSPIDSEDAFDSAKRIDVASPNFPGTDELLRVQGIDPEATPYLAIRALDEVNNAGPIAGLQLGDVTDPVDPADDIIFFDFEENQDGWRRSNNSIWHRTNDYASSGNFALRFGVDGEETFNTGGAVEGHIVSDGIDLNGAQEATLRYDQLLDVEALVDYDVARVIVLVDSEQAGVIFTKGEDDISDDFVKVELDLTPYVGQEIQLLFDFDSGDEVNNDGRGWIIDNFAIELR